MKDERKIIGQRLKEAREYLGLSQQEAASHLDIPRSAISLIETGQRGIDTIELKSFATLYQKPVSYITGEEAIPTVSPEIDVLARKADRLSPEDKETLIQYIEFLIQQSQAKKNDG